MPPRAAPALDDFNRRLLAARGGDIEALGSLLDFYRPYLLTAARKLIPDELRPKGGDSDVVQETICDALRDFARFGGDSPERMGAWLRELLRNNAADWIKAYSVRKRDLGRERRLTEFGGEALADPAPTPRTAAIRREQAGSIEAALAKLPEDERRVILLRNREHLGFDEVGRRMERSGEAARKLWARAIARLRLLLSERKP